MDDGDIFVLEWLETVQGKLDKKKVTNVETEQLFPGTV